MTRELRDKIALGGADPDTRRAVFGLVAEMDAEAAPLACAGVTTYSALKKFGARITTDPLVIIGAGGLGTFIFRGLATNNTAVILLGAMAWLNATMTLPGIAGFILTINWMLSLPFRLP